MKTVRTVILFVVIALVAIPTVPFVFFWIEAAEAIAKAERDGVLREPPGDTPLTVAERTIAIAEFEKSWNTQKFPCRPIAKLWRAVTWPDIRLSGSPVSSVLTTLILEPERSLSWHFKQVLAACQLEQHYSDTQMLRAWLSDAYFGIRPFGIENAARSLFGKSAAELDPWESAQLAALLRAPHFKSHMRQRIRSARLIAERVRVSRLR